jgi:cellulose synthase/poly-beta-1,6-N-acetylglucosamine synthase-like glycosyltransferase
MEYMHISIFLISVSILVVYAFHILVFTYGWIRLKKFIEGGISSPVTRVSVVVALRNEKENLRDLIKNLKELSYPEDKLEIILVDDHSTDGSKKYLEQLISESELSYFKMVSLEEFGIPGSKKMAIETAVTISNGELIVVTDADCRSGKDWLLTIVKAYEAGGAKMLAGPVKPRAGKGFSANFREFEFLSLAGTGAGSIGAGKPIFCNGANMAFSKSAFETVGGYSGNERYSSGDDVFLLHKIRKEFGNEAIRFVLDRRAVVITLEDDRWKSFLMQRIRWASKTRGYKDIFSISTAASVLLMNLFLLCIFILGFIYTFYFFLFGYLFMMKVMTDIPIMTGITGFFKRQRLMWWFLLFELIYIPYVIIAGFLSIIYSGSWKGRKVNHGCNKR